MTNFDQYACVPGTKEFMPDFFLDAYDDYTEGHKKIVEAQNAPEGSVQSVFTKMSKLINDEMVGKMKAVYAFDISGTNHPKAGQKYGFLIISNTNTGCHGHVLVIQNLVIHKKSGLCMYLSNFWVFYFSGFLKNFGNFGYFRVFECFSNSE